MLRLLALPLSATLLASGCGAVAPPEVTTPAARPTRASASPATPAVATYDDEVIGISFVGPAGLIVTPAQTAVDGQTTQAIFRTYTQRPPTANASPVDLSHELSMSARIARRGTNEDLRAVATRGLEGSYTVSVLAGRNWILVEGDFQSGPRKYVLIEHGPDHVLILDAFPRYSSRIAIFDQVLATLVVR